MSRTRRPLAALAMVALISATGCSNAPAATGTGTQQRQHATQSTSTGSSGGSSTATNREQAVKFAECMRDNGVSEFPDPDASGDLTIDRDSERLVAGHEQRGVQAGHQRVQGPGATGVHGRQEEPRAAGGGPQVRPVHPRQRREGLPGPRPRCAPRRHESNPIRRKERWYEHSQRRDAEVPRSRRGGRRHGGPVMRKTLGAGRSGRPGCRNRHRRRGRHVQCEARDPGRTGAAGEHREGGKGDALGHGLPGWDPDLSGAIGRLAVRRDQPGPRDVHLAARSRRQGRAAATCSTGWTTTRCCCCAARRPAYRTVSAGRRGRRRRRAERQPACASGTRQRRSYRPVRDTFTAATAHRAQEAPGDTGR